MSISCQPEAMKAAPTSTRISKASIFFCQLPKAMPENLCRTSSLNITPRIAARIGARYCQLPAKFPPARLTPSLDILPVCILAKIPPRVA